MRTPAGLLAVALLRGIGRLPIRWMLAAGTVLLPAYIPLRRRVVRTLRRLPVPVAALAYYRMRLRLALLSLRHMLDKPDGCTVEVIGGDSYRAALTSGKPVALLGWHQGPVELLHRIPAEILTPPPAPSPLHRASDDGEGRGGEEAGGGVRTFFILTASAFSPALARWMAVRRARPGVNVIPPGSMAGLRAWERERGVLAVMVDQVPGTPEAWLSLFEGRVEVPYPVRLLDWITERGAELLAVSVRWQPGNRIVFRYDPVDPGAVKSDVARLMESALDAAPEQYNWSYGKTEVNTVSKN